MQKDIKKEEVTHEIQARFENVAAALYLVTNHLSDTESLKHKVRSISQIVLEEFVVLNEASTKIIFDRLGHVRSLLKISSVAGLITKQNVTLIDGEIKIIQNAIKDLQESMSNLSVSLGKVLMLDFVGTTYSEDVSTVQDVLQNRNIQINKDKVYLDYVKQGAPFSEVSSGSSELSTMSGIVPSISANSHSLHHPLQIRIASSDAKQTQHHQQDVHSSNNQRGQNHIIYTQLNNKQVNNKQGIKSDYIHPQVNAQLNSKQNIQSNTQSKNSKLNYEQFQQTRHEMIESQKNNKTQQDFSDISLKQGFETIKNKGISTGPTERQINIIKEIKNKGQLTIRDLVGKIIGCSEKTIQRELLSLVDSGLLRKEGERRWSRYSVN